MLEILIKSVFTSFAEYFLQKILSIWVPALKIYKSYLFSVFNLLFPLPGISIIQSVMGMIWVKWNMVALSRFCFKLQTFVILSRDHTGISVSVYYFCAESRVLSSLPSSYGLNFSFGVSRVIDSFLYDPVCLEACLAIILFSYSYSIRSARKKIFQGWLFDSCLISVVQLQVNGISREQKQPREPKAKSTADCSVDPQWCNMQLTTREARAVDNLHTLRIYTYTNSPVIVFVNRLTQWQRREKMRKAFSVSIDYILLFINR